MENEFLIRHAELQDLDFLYKTWLTSYCHDSAVGTTCRTSVFFDNYRLVLDRTLAQPETTTLIACMRETPSVIFAYLVFEPGILHYAFTKGAFQKMGIAKALFAKAFPEQKQVTYTHRTRRAQPILRAKGDLFDFNPFLLYNLKGQN